jgi:hypothetical protein
VPLSRLALRLPDTNQPCLTNNLASTAAHSTLYIKLNSLVFLTLLVGNSHVRPESVRNKAVIIGFLGTWIFVQNLVLRSKNLRLMKTLQIAVQSCRGDPHRPILSLADRNNGKNMSQQVII